MKPMSHKHDAYLKQRQMSLHKNLLQDNKKNNSSNNNNDANNNNNNIVKQHKPKKSFGAHLSIRDLFQDEKSSHDDKKKSIKTY